MRAHRILEPSADRKKQEEQRFLLNPLSDVIELCREPAHRVVEYVGGINDPSLWINAQQGPKLGKSHED